MDGPGSKLLPSAITDGRVGPAGGSVGSVGPVDGGKPVEPLRHLNRWDGGRLGPTGETPGSTGPVWPGRAPGPLLHSHPAAHPSP